MGKKAAKPAAKRPTVNGFDRSFFKGLEDDGCEYSETLGNVTQAWFGGESHMIHLYNPAGKEYDVYTIGDSAKDKVTLAEVKRAMRSWWKDTENKYGSAFIPESIRKYEYVSHRPAAKKATKSGTKKARPSDTTHRGFTIEMKPDWKTFTATERDMMERQLMSDTNIDVGDAGADYIAGTIDDDLPDAPEAKLIRRIRAKIKTMPARFQKAVKDVVIDE